jgi:hypothetical protein
VEKGIVRAVRPGLARWRTDLAIDFGRQVSASGKVDLLMSWVVGVLLVAVAAGLIGWRLSL